jgi:hypothetical protein
VSDAVFLLRVYPVPGGEPIDLYSNHTYITENTIEYGKWSMFAEPIYHNYYMPSASSTYTFVGNSYRVHLLPVSPGRIFMGYDCPISEHNYERLIRALGERELEDLILGTRDN